MKKSKKKKIIPLLIAISLLLVVLIVYITVSPKDNLAFEVGDKVKVSDLIKRSNFVCVKDKDSYIDTSEVGVKTAYISGLKTKKVRYVVVDTIAPIFDDLKWFSIIEGDNIDNVRNNLNVYDNSNKPVDLELRGTYDFNKSGMYKVTVVARDGNGNVSSQDFDMIVEIPGGKAHYFTTSNGHYGYEKDGLTFVDGILIVNKTYSITPDYYHHLWDEFLEAYEVMNNDMNSEGLNLVIQSGHRLNSFQTVLYNGSVESYGKALADIKTARPGHSEHEAGLAADFNYVARSFENSAEFKWLNKNCYKYGFILRYPEGKEEETGYEYEPWHYRYVGEDLAKIIYNNGDWLTLEGYFGLESKYKD